MLYDPRWEKKTKADPFALESLIAWLEGRDPAAEYCWEEPATCLLGQFATAMGDIYPSGKSLELSGSEPFAEIALRFPYTYGDALHRARSALTAGERR